MADGDRPFDPGTQNTDPSTAIRDAISKVIGDPALAGMITQVFQTAFGNAMRSQIVNQAGSMQGAVPFGGSTLMAPMDVGGQLSDYYQRRAVSAAMQTAFDQMNYNRFRFDMQVKQGLGLDPNAAAGFTLTGFMANQVFNRLQPSQFLAGLEEGSRYLGVGGMYGLSGDSAQWQQRRNLSVEQLMGGVSRDFFRSGGFREYGGMGGQDVGRLVAEMARTGGYASYVRDLEGMGDNQAPEAIAQNREKAIRGITAVTREAARTVNALRQIFEGEVPQILDQINQLTGTTFLQTFGPSGTRMINQVAAAGLLTGYTPQNMQQLMAASGNMSRSLGRTPWGAAANARDIALQMTLLRGGPGEGGGGAMAFIDEPAYRDAMVRRVTGAQESLLARDLAGAAAYIAGQNGDVGAFTAAMNQATRGGRVTTGTILQYLRNTPGGGDLTAMDLRNMSYTLNGERMRAEGMFTGIAMNSSMAILENNRRADMERNLGGEHLDAATRARVMKAIADSPMGFTYDNMMDQFKRVTGREMGVPTAGAIRRAWNSSAISSGFAGEADVNAYLAGGKRREELGVLFDRLNARTKLQERFVGRGAYSGLLNFMSLFEAGVAGRDFGEVYNALLGRQNVTQTELAAQTTSGGELFALLRGMAGTNVDSQYGIGATFSAWTTGMIGNQMLTEKQLAEVQAIYELTPDEAKLADKNKIAEARMARMAEWTKKNAPLADQVSQKAILFMKNQYKDGAAAFDAKSKEIQDKLDVFKKKVDAGERLTSEERAAQKKLEKEQDALHTPGDELSWAAQEDMVLAAMAENDTTRAGSINALRKKLESGEVKQADYAKEYETLKGKEGKDSDIDKLRRESIEKNNVLKAALMGDPQSKVVMLLTEIANLIREKTPGKS